MITMGLDSGLALICSLGWDCVPVIAYARPVRGAVIAVPVDGEALT